MDYPTHAFPPKGSPAGRGLCGAYLSRGWLDATRNYDNVTCDRCKELLEEQQPREPEKIVP